MDEYEIVARVRVRAVSARKAEEMVETLLSDETALSPAVEVESIETIGSIQGGA